MIIIYQLFGTDTLLYAKDILTDIGWFKPNYPK